MTPFDEDMTPYRAEFEGMDCRQRLTRLLDILDAKQKELGTAIADAHQDSWGTCLFSWAHRDAVLAKEGLAKLVRLDGSPITPLVGKFFGISELELEPPDDFAGIEIFGGQALDKKRPLIQWLIENCK